MEEDIRGPKINSCPGALRLEFEIVVDKCMQTIYRLKTTRLPLQQEATFVSIDGILSGCNRDVTEKKKSMCYETTMSL